MNEKIIDRLKKWQNGEEAPPEKVQIYPTNLCNLNCIFCAQRNKDYGYEKEVSGDVWREVTREIGEMGVKRILISGGGEPFLKPDITLSIMKIAKDYDIEGRLITNGISLNQEISQKIVDMSWDTVVFSMDGPNAKIHDYLRGKEGAFKKTIENLKMLREMDGDGKPQIEVNFVLTNRNYEDIPEMVSLCKEMGINSINFEPVTINNDLDRNLRITKDQRKDLIENVIPIAKRIIDGKITSNLDKLKEIKMEKAGEITGEIKKNVTDGDEKNLINSPCFEPWLWPKIEANGDVWPCSTSPLHENIKEKSFSEIWFGKKFNKFRNRILNRDLSEHCNNCVTSHIQINNQIRKRLIEHSNSVKK